MSNVKFGKSDWSENPGFSGGEGEKAKVDYMGLPPGTHTVRLITDRYDYAFMKVKLDSDPAMVNGKPYYGDKIKVSLPLETNPLIQQLGLKPKQGCYAGVIDRKTGTTRVLDMSPQIRQALNKWRGKKGYKDLKGFDFDIVVDPQSKSSFYSVLPSIPEALDEEDLAKKKAFDESVLERLAQPIGDHETMLKWLNERRAKNGLAPIVFDGVASAPKAETTATTAISASDEDGDVEFTAA